MQIWQAALYPCRHQRADLDPEAQSCVYKHPCTAPLPEFIELAQGGRNPVLGPDLVSKFISLDRLIWRSIPFCILVVLILAEHAISLGSGPLLYILCISFALQ
jgi:hypothetical protein